METAPDAGGLCGDLLEGVRGTVSVHILGAQGLMERGGSMGLEGLYIAPERKYF